VDVRGGGWMCFSWETSCVIFPYHTSNCAF
jgi:hypothetical protein